MAAFSSSVMGNPRKWALAAVVSTAAVVYFASGSGKWAPSGSLVALWPTSTADKGGDANAQISPTRGPSPTASASVPGATMWDIADAKVQGYCDIWAGDWKPVADRSAGGVDPDDRIRILWPAASGGSSRPGRLSPAVSSGSRGRHLEDRGRDVTDTADDDSQDSKPSQEAPASSGDLERAMRHPAWSIAMDDHVRRQYGWLGRQRRKHLLALQSDAQNGVDANSGGNKTGKKLLESQQQRRRRRLPSAPAGGKEKSPSQRGADDHADRFVTLPLVDSMSHANTMRDPATGSHAREQDADAVAEVDGAALWGWPFTELWPMPSLVSVGEEEGMLTSRADRALIDDRLAYLLGLVSSAQLKKQPPMSNSGTENGMGVGKEWNGPIHAPLNLEVGVGEHSRDSLRYNGSSQHYLPYLHHTISFSLSQHSLQVLKASELSYVRGGMERACASLHDAWSSRLKEAVAAYHGWMRDRGCDITAEYTSTVDHAAATSDRVRRALHGGEDAGGRHGGAAFTADGEPEDRHLLGNDDADDPYVPGAQSADASTAAAGGMLTGVLYDIVLDIATSDAASFERSRPHATLNDEGGGEDTGGDASIPGAADVAYDDIAVPYLGADESHSIHVGSSPSAALGAGVNLEFDERRATSLAAHGRSQTVWGALHALQSIAQVLESWGVVRNASTLPTRRGSVDDSVFFRSPTMEIITGVLNRTTTAAASASGGCTCAVDEAIAVAAAAAAHVTSRCKLQTADVTDTVAGFVDHAAPVPAVLPLLIVDRPWKPWRGLSQDTSRHWLPVQSIKQLLDGLAASKMNVFHWHFSDAQSFPLKLARHPELAQFGAWSADKTYSTDDVRSIVRYAAERGIRIIPELDMPAHAAAWGKAHPNVLVHCTSIGGSSLKEMDLYALDPSHNATYDLIAEIFGELASLFPDQYLHIGADEVAPDCWASEPRVVDWAKTRLPSLFEALPSRSMPEPHRVYAVLLTYFLHRVHNVVFALGKKTSSWEDSFEKIHETGGRRVLQQEQLGDSDAASSWASADAGRELEDGVTASAARPGFLRSALRKLSHALHLDSRPARVLPATKASDTAPALDPVRLPMPTPLPSKGLWYPRGSVIQGWKCWVQHADPVILNAAQDGANWAERIAKQRSSARGNGSTPSSDAEVVEGSYTDLEADPQYGHGRGVIQSSCWYPDWSSPWADQYRHWPLPESASGLQRASEIAKQLERADALLSPSSSSTARKGSERDTAARGNADTDDYGELESEAIAVQQPSSQQLYPSPVFASHHPYWGGEMAMWLERVDVSNIQCRVMPRASVVGEILWSESMVYDRYARGYGVEPPFAGHGTLPRADSPQVMNPTLFAAAPRYLHHTRRLLRRGIPAAPVTVYDIRTKPNAAIAAFADPALKFENDQWPFNGMCPGIEQTVQRSAKRAIDFATSTWSDTADTKAAPPSIATGANGSTASPASPAPITFATWNIHDGGGTHGRYAGIMRYLRKMDVDVIGIVEGMGWDGDLPNRRQLADSLFGSIQVDANGDQLQHELDGHHAAARRLGITVDHHSSDDRSAAASVPEAMVAGVDEVEYAGGRSLADDALPPLDTTVDTAAHITQQTAGFRRRAATAGYAHAHLLKIESGYHLALLSSRPMTVVYEDTEHFERGVLVADVAGIRFVLVHLHAQDAHVRIKEARWIANLVNLYTQAGLPTIVLGDLNSLNPLDADCHAKARTIDALLQPAVPSYLHEKYLCRTDAGISGSADPGCASQLQDGVIPYGAHIDEDHTPADPNAHHWRIDYRPVHAIITAPGGGDANSNLVDLTLLQAASGNTTAPKRRSRARLLADSSSNTTAASAAPSVAAASASASPEVPLPSASSSPAAPSVAATAEPAQPTSSSIASASTSTVPSPSPSASSVPAASAPDTTSIGAGCLYSYPTSALGPHGDDAGNDNGHVPLRIDVALANRHFMKKMSAMQNLNADTSKRQQPFACRIGGVDAGTRLPEELLDLSDHLPLVCS